MEAEMDSNWIDEGVREGIPPGYKFEAARGMLSKMWVCGRCMLCVCGVRTPALHSAAESELRASLVRVTGIETVSAWGETDVACSMCLGILQHAESAVEAVREKVAEQYDAKSLSTFLTSLAVPSSCAIRQRITCAHAHRHLKESEADVPAVTMRNGMVEVKEAFRNVVVKGIAKAIGAEPDQSASDEAVGRLKITMNYTHEETGEEKEKILENAAGVKKRVRAKRSYDGRKGQLIEIDNTGRVSQELEKMSDDALLSMYGHDVIGAVKTEAEIRVHVERESVYLGGSYCKLSRQVSQTPWNEAHGDVKHSVQSLIVAVVGGQYEAEHVKFMGAGREDLDVRMLGTGRPFLLEFVNARSLPTAPHVRVGKEEVADRDAAFPDLEDKVNQSTGLIEIRELRSVGKEWVKMLKNAGESKVKTYQAVVWMERPVSAAALQQLSDKAPFNIDQTTPIRVLHRRSLAVRKRMVHKIKCEAINPHFMIITLSTEAGTYIKEFVHGDMGRTQPNVGELLGCGAADILQLDVVAVEM